MAASGNDGNGEERLSTAEAADALRDLRDNVGPDQLTETFETGGGLMGHEESDLRAAIDVLGTRRSAEILGVDVPDGGVPGEQRTLGGERARTAVPEEPPEPIPRGAATLSTFDPDGDEDDEPDDTLTCRSFHAMIDRALVSAQRGSDFRFAEFLQPINRAEDRGCISAADATRLRDSAGRVTEADPENRLLDQIMEDANRAFAGGSGNG